MRYLVFVCFLCLNVVLARGQSDGKTLSMKLSKNAVPVIIDYGTGFHTIFIDHKSLSYTRMNYDFSPESKGSIELTKMGYKAKIIEVAANRKNIILYSTRADSNGLRVRTVNTISHSMKKTTVVEDWKSSTLLLGHFSLQDTSHFIISNEPNQLSYIKICEGKVVSRNEFVLQDQIFEDWVYVITKWPQLSKHLIHEKQLERDDRIPFGKVKLYHSQRELVVTIDHSYKTHVLKLNPKLNALDESTYVIDIPMSGSISGSISNSYIHKDHIFQVIMTRGGCIIQKSDLVFKKQLYNKFISYHYTKKTSSPVFKLNMPRGEFAKNNGEPLEYNGESTDRHLGLKVYKKGPFDHFYISEIQPTHLLKDWLKRTTALAPTNFSESVNNFKIYLGIQFQQPAHFTFLQHVQCKSATMGVSLDMTGGATPFLGKENFPLAEASNTYHQIINKGIRPAQSTMACIDRDAYYCFYWRSKRLYQFIPIN